MIIANLSLVAKLKTDFGLDMAACGFDEDSFATDERGLERFYGEVADVISKQSRWKVASNEIALGFFSFGKFLMFKDLDPKSWPEEKQPDANGVMKRLLGSGFGDRPAAYAEDINIDSVIKPGDVRFVKDADSSQTEAILEVREGSNLVIQGPPGTGKSQTITNIIAELIGQKKTVLFVAEKMAALEVVKRRLDESHLSDGDEEPVINLREVVTALRFRLPDEVEDLPPSHSAGCELTRMLVRLTQMERLLLPRKKQRALEQMTTVLPRWAKQPGWVRSSAQADEINTLLEVLESSGKGECPDWGQLADAWLDLVRPAWSRYLDHGGRKATMTRLRHLQKELLAEPIPAQRVIERISGIAMRQTWEERIVACVLGYTGG